MKCSFWGLVLLINIQAVWAAVIANDTFCDCLSALRVMALMNGGLISKEKGYLGNGTFTLVDVNMILQHEFTDALTVKILEYYASVSGDTFTVKKWSCDGALESTKGKGDISVNIVLTNNGLGSLYILKTGESNIQWGIECSVNEKVKEKLGLSSGSLHTLPAELSALNCLNEKMLLLLVIAGNLGATSGSISAYNYDRYIIGTLLSVGVNVDLVVELFWKIQLPSKSEMIKLRDLIGLYLSDVYYLTVIDGQAYVANDEGISRQMKSISRVKTSELSGVVGVKSEKSFIDASLSALLTVQSIQELLAEFSHKSSIMRKLHSFSKWRLNNSLDWFTLSFEGMNQFESADENPIYFIWMLLDQLDRDSGTSLFKNQFRGVRKFWNGSRVPFSMLRLDFAMFPMSSLSDLIQKTIDLYHMSILKFPRTLMIVLNEPSSDKMTIERVLRFSNRVIYTLSGGVFEKDKKISALVGNQQSGTFFEVNANYFQVLKAPLRIVGVKILFFTLAEA
jgi:hypothetical protein